LKENGEAVARREGERRTTLQEVDRSREGTTPNHVQTDAIFVEHKNRKEVRPNGGEVRLW